MVRVVPSFANQTIFVDVIDVACINSNFFFYTCVPVESIACLAGHTYSVASYCLTITSIIVTLGPRKSKTICAGSTSLLFLFAVDTSHTLTIL